MRDIVQINDGWYFKKDPSITPPAVDESFERVDLPHTYNAVDGMDGSKPWRGSTWYIKKIDLPKGPVAGGRVYVEVGAASLYAEVFINGTKVCDHKGGYAAFRAEITDYLCETGENLLQIRVDNSLFTDIYPQMADFTFYGGLTRGVRLISVPATHFALGYFGGDGIAVTSKPIGSDAEVDIKTWIEGDTSDINVGFEILDEDMCEHICEVWRPAESEVSAKLVIPGARYWSIADPRLYIARVTLMVHNEPIDEIAVRFGVREYSVDPQKGFILNGEQIPLRGVAKHADRMYKGTAVSFEDLYEDAELIKELGANTVRCAHYQHQPEFYDLCDELGLVVWAEIPYISVQADDPNAHQVAMQMMTELIIQNYNHPSICFWGLSNEITMGGIDKPNLIENHRELNELAHRLDPTRLTTMAHISTTPRTCALHDISDVESYNHYFGWYGGSVEDNAPWLDSYHTEYPDRCLGLSEYGAEGIVSYHTEHPAPGDYSEEYQALYHSAMCDVLDARPWMWSSHVWNMFDFGCSARDEGGVKGRNNKGLVTCDRRVRKDSFYVCKAHWNKTEPFVHICGHRYAMRSGDVTRVMVCTNCSDAQLKVNGKRFGSTDGAKVKIFEEVPLTDGENVITLECGELIDRLSVVKVNVEPASYKAPENPQAAARKAAAEGVKNWFEGKIGDEKKQPEFSEKHYSVKDKVCILVENDEVCELLKGLIDAEAMRSGEGMAAMARNMTLEQNLGYIGTIPEGGLEALEAKLAKIKK